GHSRDRLLRETKRLGWLVELHLARRPGRKRRAGPLQHVSVFVVERTEGSFGVRRLHVRPAFQTTNPVVPAARGALRLHRRTCEGGGRQVLYPVRHGGAPRLLRQDVGQVLGDGGAIERPYAAQRDLRLGGGG